MVDISWLSLIMVVNTPETEIHEPYENKTEKKKKQQQQQQQQQHCMRGNEGLVQMSLK